MPPRKNRKNDGVNRNHTEDFYLNQAVSGNRIQEIFLDDRGVHVLVAVCSEDGYVDVIKVDIIDRIKV